MRTLNEDLFKDLQELITSELDNTGRTPSVRKLSEMLNVPKSTIFKYMRLLEERGLLVHNEFGYETVEHSMAERKTQAVAILGSVPCGPLTETFESVEGYIKLPESFTGKGKFFLLKADGNSMIDAGISDGDLVLVRQQEKAEVGNIVVALVDNEVTLKRLAYDDKQLCHYLHPENKTMEDIYVEDLKIQGVAIKVIKDLI